MHALAPRQPWLAAALLGRFNRFHAASKAARIASVLLLTFVLAVLVGMTMTAAHHRLGTLPASLRWWLAAGFAAWTAAWSRRRIRDGIAEQHRGWMQAWPLARRSLLQQQALLASVPVLAVAVWPAIIGGLMMATGATRQIGWDVAGCCLGLLVGVCIGCWPEPGREANEHASPLLLSRADVELPFSGLAQLREWQKCAVAKLSLRRWVLWMAPILLMAPSGIGGRAIAQILLVVLVWPFYARGMAASLDTIRAASELLAATPMTASALCRPLLRRPIAYATALALAVALDLAWLGASVQATAAVWALIVLFEAGRMAFRCGSARRTLTACIPRTGFEIRGQHDA